MSKKVLAIICVLICLFITGCASNKILLTKNQKSIDLASGEGGIIFSFYSEGDSTFTPYSITIQEVNQYKDFNKKVLQPVAGYSNNKYNKIYLYSLKLSKGTYKIVYFEGLLGGWTKFFVPCDRVFDIEESAIGYGGRLGVKLTRQGFTYVSFLDLKDLYEEDSAAFLQTYPALGGKKITKELIY